MSSVAKIKIYGSEHCPYCTAARMLLKKKGLRYEDVMITQDPARREEMQRLTGRRKVPQIFIGDRPIGGFDELYTLEQSGELDRILNEPAVAPAE